MRVLPCDNCGTAKLPGGQPYLIGNLTPHKFPFRVPCAGCKRVTYVTAAQYNLLPRVSLPTTQRSDASSDDSANS